MPKMKPIQVDTRKKVNQLVDKQYMILSGELDAQKTNRTAAINSLQGGRNYIETHDGLNLKPYNKRTAMTAIDKALKVPEPMSAGVRPHGRQR